MEPPFRWMAFAEVDDVLKVPLALAALFTVRALVLAAVSTVIVQDAVQERESKVTALEVVGMAQPGNPPVLSDHPVRGSVVVFQVPVPPTQKREDDAPQDASVIMN